MRDAGIIGFVPRGEYSDTETYDFLQFVYYGDSTYVAKKKTTGNTPAENNEYWQLLAKGRTVGVTGVKGNTESSYRTGDVNITADNVGALPLSGGTVGTNNPVPLEIINNGNDDTAIGFKNKGVNLGNVNFGVERFQIFSNNMNGIISKQILVISNGARSIYDYKSKSLKEILVRGEASGSIELPRIDTGDANYKPGKDIFEVKEFGSKSSNIPTTHYYHILTGQGSDANQDFATQLALGMTTEAIYYRAMMSDSFKKWHKVAFDEVPTVKETILSIKNGDLTVEGVIGSNYTNITDIIIKANTGSEGMIIGISSNRMGYVRSNNFQINFSNLTNDEKKLLQSFYTIKFYVPNNSPNYPILRPVAVDHDAACRINGEKVTTKMTIGANDNQIYYTYVMPKEFREHDISKNLIFYTEDWEALVGINIKDY